MTTRISHWIDGNLTEGSSGRTGPVFNPATGDRTGEVDLAGPDEIKLAVASAAAAAKEWRLASLSQRAAVLFAFRELLLGRADELTAIVT
ncbi:MAG: aldehyde dehydrogenase family protein, partial [Nocardioides sp.]